MIERFLKAQHWQLFLLTFGIPLIFQIVAMGTLIAGVQNGNVPDFSLMFSYLQFLPIMMMIFIGVFFGWFWSVAIGLQYKVPTDVKMKVTKFKMLFAIPMTYIVALMLFVGVQINTIMTSNTGFDPELITSLIPIILPIHLFSMFCIFYSLYFVAKTVKTVELQREVSFSDFAGEFFMIWFYPIGIWILQPQINKMVEEELY